MDSNWFVTQKIEEDLYLTTEPKFFVGNRCNIWLLKGSDTDVIIDTGLGVRNLREHLVDQGLIDLAGGNRKCVVICTHVHFDHSGGAHHFEDVYIHKDDLQGLHSASQMETLNYVKDQHFDCKPYPEFNAFRYKVPPTQCSPLENGQELDIGDSDKIKIIHVPGHTKGSIMVYYPKKGYLFTGDFAYECNHGTEFLDWLPTSSVPDYVTSCRRVLDWLQQPDVFVRNIYPGHFSIFSKERLEQLLMEYVDNRKDFGICGRSSMGCLKAGLTCWIGCGIFRCCPC